MKLSTQIFLGFLVAISIDLLDSFVNYTLTLQVKTDSDFLSRSEAIIRNSSALSKGIVIMESAFRGYLLTGDEHFLVGYTNGLHSLPSVAEEERGDISSGPQRRIFDSIIALHDKWIAYANQIIYTKRKAGTAGSSDAQYANLIETQLKRGVGSQYNDQIADLFRKFDRNEYKVREERRRALSESIYRTDRYSLVFSIVLIVVGVSIAIYFVSKISRRIGSLVQHAQRISTGNFTMVQDDARDELSSVSNSLNAMSDKLSRNISELERKNAELDQFAYVVSHDLKAPVRGISNVVQWIEEDLNKEISPRMRKYLNFILERIERIEALIYGLLQYARISRDESLKENVDVAALINDLVEIMVPKDFKVIASGLPVVVTEKVLLQQVFGNLISNAAKYTRPKSGKIVISCAEMPSFYEFSVSDNGPGIDPIYHEKIFVIFQTLRERDDKESTGIGLAIVKKIIEGKHCTIKVVSSPGKGASFIFTWPRQ
ncbi:MAG TPA: ATP-binding protein [Puia sp.]|nr:ATP-binding protein [Puia sp.]